MEINAPGHNQQPLPQELRSSIESTALAVNLCMETQDAQVLVDELNQEAVIAYIIGKNVHLQSEFVIRSRYALNLKTHLFEATAVPDMPHSVIVEGVFVGFEQYSYQDQKILMYKIQLPYDEDGGSFDVITVPTTEAELNVMMTPQVDVDSEAEANMYANFELLSQYKDEKFQEELKKFISLIENTEEVSAAYLNNLADIATRMITYEGISSSEDMQNAIVKIFALQVEPGSPYDIYGHRFSKDEKGEWLATVIKVSAIIENVVLVNDYDINDGSRLVVDTSWQPAFTFTDFETGDVVHMPIRQLTEFTNRYLDTGYCSDSIERYKLHFPANKVA